MSLRWSDSDASEAAPLAKALIGFALIGLALIGFCGDGLFADEKDEQRQA